MGGTYYTAQGGGSNLLCLRNDPIFREAEDENSYSHRTQVHGAEYRYQLNYDLNYHEIPCAICQVVRRSVLMMPGTNLCNEGWSTEYAGQISAAADDYQRSEFICLDDDAEPTHGSSPTIHYGVTLFSAETACGSLPCLPYLNAKDLLCVVCTR